MTSTLSFATAPAVRGPVRSGERALAPDLARGFMLLFIALANAGGVVFAANEPGLDASPHGWERVANFVMMLLISGHAYPVFAVMFGYGLVQLSRRQQAAGASPAAARNVLIRRNAWLVVFGAVHGVLLYFGDFLGAYGLVGIAAACLLVNRGDRFHRLILVLWGLVLLELAVFAVITFNAIGSATTVTAPVTSTVASLEADSYGAAVLARLSEWPAHTVTVVGFVFIVWLGIWGARRRLLEDAGRYRGLLVGVAVTGLGVGVLGSIPQGLVSAGVLTTDESARSWILLLHNMGGMFAGPGYVALFGLVALWLRNRSTVEGPIVGAFAALGRRSLSGYLFQSVAWLILLQPYTLHLQEWLPNPTATFLTVATATWLATVLMAAALQRRQAAGPAEFVLRRLTYGARR